MNKTSKSAVQKCFLSSSNYTFGNGGGGGELSDVLVCMNMRLGGCQLGLKEEQEGLDPKTSKAFLNPSQEFYEGRCQLYVWSIKSYVKTCFVFW